MDVIWNNTTIAFALILGACIILLIWVVRLEFKIYKLLAGGGGSTLEDSLVHLTHKYREHDNFRTEVTNYLKKADARMLRSVQGVGVVRFNPFPAQGGGNQSFAIALLNEQGDGVVLSSLYAREHVSIYAKPIKAGSSEFELTAEERAAIDNAKANSTTL